TDYECKHEAIIPCCGNGECEETESWSACQEDCECALDCGPCEIPDNETCSCIPKTACVQDGCCPGNCTYLEDSDCPRPSVVFSEIYYNPQGSDDDHEWIEIYNNGSTDVSVSGWKLEEGGTQHGITPINADTLAGGSYAVIAENITQFAIDYPEYSGTLLDSSFSLSNTGEPLALRAGKDGYIVDALFYNSIWGGNGFSIEKIDLNGPNAQENWNESTQGKGTPGYKNSIS
ncbi:MAG TPA: lamin tail domain-containing protein, partial [archaeon]|nr:lamin tail domain-containing protein [archaeon]